MIELCVSSTDNRIEQVMWCVCVCVSQGDLIEQVILIELCVCVCGTGDLIEQVILIELCVCVCVCGAQGT